MELRQSKQEYEMTHELTYYECDENGQPTLSMVMGIMSVVSSEHSKRLGITRETIYATGGAWVITGFSGKLALHELQIGDQIVVGTRATGYNRFLASREFWIRDVNGDHEYAHIRAMLVFMNLKTRKMEPIPAELIQPYAALETLRLPRVTKPKRIKAGVDLQEKDYHVRYFDLDTNHHVNNARYFDWLMDPLGEAFLASHHLTEFAIQYSHEVRANHDVSSQFLMAEPQRSIHRITNDGEVCTLAEFRWQKSK